MIAIVRRSAFALVVLLAAGCGERKEAPAAAAPPAAPTPAAEPPAPPAAEPAAPSAPEAPGVAKPTATATSTSTPTATATSTATSTSTSTSTPTPTPTATSTPTPTPTPTPTATPAAPTTTAARAKVGADKCKMCHRVQHQSWAASPHAAKGLDCEACHGNGGEYWPASIMRDREKAVAAGLVVPDLASCRRCHGAKADAALYERVHAHKAR